MFDAAKRRSAETFVESSEWISALAFNPLSSHPPIQAFKIHCQKNFGEEGRVAFPSYLPYIGMTANLFYEVSLVSLLSVDQN